MPLRDHFKPPLPPLFRWESFHAQWASKMVDQLNEHVLPERYVAAPLISLESGIEVDVGSFEDLSAANGAGGIATFAPPKAKVEMAIDFTGLDTFEVRINETATARLAAAVELVSPANKDRPANREAFARKCASYLQEGASVVIVDVVTERQANLIQELLAFFDKKPRKAWGVVFPLYAVALRAVRDGKKVRLQGWPEELRVDEALPTLPLWLAADLAVPLDLEASYEETCRILRIP